MRRLALLVLLPALAEAKPAYWSPRDNVADGEAQAKAATARLSAAIRAKNVGAINDVLGTTFTNNGMWFPDAACAKKFEQSGEVRGADVRAFARCLAKLPIQMSTRKSSLRDGGVLTIDPGVEIELAFKGDQLRWIGFPLQGGADRAIPMLTAQALEALRTQGTTVLDAKVATELDLELAKQRVPVVTSWMKVCLDDKGTVVKLQPFSSSSTTTSDAFLSAVGDWKFQAFKVKGVATPACGVSLLAYPSAKAPVVEIYPSTNAPAAAVTRVYDFDDDEDILMGGLLGPPPPPPPPPPSPQNVAPSLIEALRIAGNKLIVPDASTKALMVRSGKPRVVASMKMCLDDKGNVTSVSQLKSSGYAAYDRLLAAEMRQWIYRPYKVNGRAVPVCTAVTFIYDASKP